MNEKTKMLINFFSSLDYTQKPSGRCPGSVGQSESHYITESVCLFVWLIPVSWVINSVYFAILAIFRYAMHVCEIKLKVEICKLVNFIILRNEYASHHFSVKYKQIDIWLLNFDVIFVLGNPFLFYVKC